MIYETEHATKRELESSSLIAYHLERFGYRAVWAKIEDLFMIDLIKPEAVLLSDTYNPENLIAARYIKDRGYPLITFEAEVTYYPNYFPDLMVWGWNKEKVMYEDLVLIASDYVKDILAKQGKDTTKCVTTGVHRFDIYPSTTFLDKKGFTKTYDLSDDKKIVSYASWGFESFFDKENALLFYYTDYDDPLCERIRQFKNKIHDWLEGLIQNMPDVIFVLKLHPATELASSEVSGLESYYNVLVIRSETLAPDLISASDVWITFNSTTILEAYYFDKPVLICSLDPELDKILVPYVAGADCVRTVEQARDLIRSYLENRSPLPDHSLERQRICREFVNDFDGLNAYRCAQAVHRFFTTNKQHGSPRWNKAFWRTLLRSTVRRIATPLYDHGFRLAFLRKCSGPNRFFQRTVSIYRSRINDRLSAFLRNTHPGMKLYN